MRFKLIEDLPIRLPFGFGERKRIGFFTAGVDQLEAGGHQLLRKLQQGLRLWIFIDVRLKQSKRRAGVGNLEGEVRQQSLFEEFVDIPGRFENDVPRFRNGFRVG